jgi:hypothetical protein
MPCARCGHGIRAGKGIPLPDGRAVCDRCADTGVLARRLDCGCMGRPGVKVIDDGGMRRCARHAHQSAIDWLTTKREG